MPGEYEKGSTKLDEAVDTPPPDKYENEIQFVLTHMLQRYSWPGESYYYDDLVIVCGFLAQTNILSPSPSSASEDRPISFYLAVFSLVYCVVLTVIFAVWACRHPQLLVVSRRVVPVRSTPQVVVQQPTT